MTAARGTFDKTINVVVGVLLPVGAAVAGFFMPTVLGGGLAVANAYNSTITGGTGSSMGNRLGWGAQALINGIVGGAFWTLRHMDGLIAKAIGGIAGGFFLGSALGCLPGLIGGKQISGGLIDTIEGGIHDIATEG